MFYYLYEVRNNLNGKIYVGVHKTKSLDDGYMGSGKVINAAINKYGIENFTKVIQEQFDNSAAMYAREKEVVTDEFLARTDVYNLRLGGTGGFDYVNRNTLSLAARNAKNREITNKILENKYGEHWRSILGKLAASAAHTEAANNKRTQTRKDKDIKSDASYMQTNISNLKRKETFKRIGHSQGQKNSQFGKIWITNGIVNQKIKKDCVIQDGWHKGRIIQLLKIKKM